MTITVFGETATITCNNGATILGSYSWGSISYPPNILPSKWTISGSNDNVNWYLVDQQTSFTGNLIYVSPTGPFADNAYLYFRVILQNSGQSGNMYTISFNIKDTSNNLIPGTVTQNNIESIYHHSDTFPTSYNFTAALNNEDNLINIEDVLPNYSTSDGSYTGSLYTAVIISTGILVTSITSSPSSITDLEAGGMEQLILTISPSDASDNTVTYSSEDTNIATVNSEGLVTGIGEGGPINITITANDGSGVSTTVPVTVLPVVCVIGETEILMADYSIKMIKEIKRGDEVMIDKVTNKFKKVSRIVKSMYRGEVTRIPKRLLGNRKPIILTGGHPIWVNKDSNRICGRDIYKRQLVNVYETFYNIQFDDEGTYYANGVKMDSLSPNNHQYKLPKELYFDESKYDDKLIIIEEDDERRGKPKMIPNLSYLKYRYTK